MASAKATQATLQRVLTGAKRKDLADSSRPVKKARLAGHQKVQAHGPLELKEEQPSDWTEISPECHVLYKEAAFSDADGYFNFLKVIKLVMHHKLVTIVTISQLMSLHAHVLQNLLRA